MGFSRPTDRVLFLAYADHTAAAAAVEKGRDLRHEYGLRGTLILPQHIHSTLRHIGDAFCPPPDDLIAALIERANGVSMPPFRVSFDRVESFNGGAVVLRGEEGVIGLEMLHEQLKVALGIKSKKFDQFRFTPHVTLLRDKHRRVHSMPIEPIEWTVREFVLVHSLLGRTTHRVLARFPLIRPPP